MSTPPRKSARLIDGKKLADDILLALQTEVKPLDPPPGLAAILVGDDPASRLYVRNKKRACEKVGIAFHEYLCGSEYFDDITEEQLLKMIDWLNDDDEVDGIIIQLPLPTRFNTATIIDHLNPDKDVDGFHPLNRQRQLENETILTSPLIEAITHIIRSTGEELVEKKGVVVSKNKVFGEPLAEALQQSGLITTVVSPDEPKLQTQTNQADILISIVGKKHFITPKMVKPGAMVIDVGTTMTDDKTFAGDVAPTVAKVAGWLTPVPGGVGPLTVAMLLKNTIRLYRRHHREDTTI